MYEKHFALDKRPFADGLRSEDVFVGPQIAAAIGGLKKALARPDAVVAVSGPAGVGKTLVVAKALEALGPQYKLIRIGRMHLDDSDVMEYLLQSLGVAKPPSGAVRRFAAFRKLLEAVQAQKMRVVVVVEDALRIGVETLAELEAVTAADAGPSGGANIVLMGNDSLANLLGDAELERMTQRTRYRQRVEPMNVAELRGYLKHRLRQAGGDFEKIFDKDSVDRLAMLTGGNPRVVDNLADAALSAAARGEAPVVAASLISSVAADELGLSVAESAPPPDDAELIVESGVVSEAAAAPEAAAASEGTDVPEPETAPLPEPVIVFSDEPVEPKPPLEDDEIPELIQDTLPDLEILAPEVMAAAESVEREDEAVPTLEVLPEPTGEPEPAQEAGSVQDPDDLPELEPLDEFPPAAEPATPLHALTEPEEQPRSSAEPETATESAVESQPRDVPEWERDPTLAQLQPDLDALEAAMAVDAVDEDEPVEVATPPEPMPDPEPEEIPEITLDNAIRQRIDSNLIDEPGQISPTASDSSPASAGSEELPEIKLAPAKSKKADAELERIASELAKAKTIEDVDEKMAETLFGEEISFIAAQVLASGSDTASANDGELSQSETPAPEKAQASGIPAGIASGNVGASLDPPGQNGASGADLSISQRMRTVRALHADPQPASPSPEASNLPEPRPGVSARDAEKPAPIEDQINISMTQTLKALNVQPPVLDEDETEAYDDDDEDDKKSGFFSRFRRS